MKIGNFASKFNVSIDTIRHYIDLGLLVPPKNGKLYHFNEKCFSDMNLIIEMKSLGFTLNEIKFFQFYNRISKLKNIESDFFYQNIIKSKIDYIENSITKLNKIHTKLKNKLSTCNNNKFNSKNKIGIPLDILTFFRCPSCNKKLVFSGTNIINNNIINGFLNCSCGFFFHIIDGIIISKTLNSSYNKYSNMSIDNNFLSDYVINTSFEYFDMIYKSIEWCYDNINFEDLDQKFIIELGSGVGLLLRTLYDKLPENSVYFCIDNNHELNLFLKSIIENSISSKKIIFLSTSFHEIPIQHNSIDYIFDFAGTSNFMLNFKENTLGEFLLKDLNPLFKRNTILYSSYLLFNKYSNNHNYIPQKYKHKFKEVYTLNEISKTGFLIESSMRSNTVSSGGKYDNFFVDGDEVYTLNIIAKKE